MLVRPRRFFRAAVTPGEQATGVVVAGLVVAVEEATRLALVPDAVPALAGGRLASAALVVGLAALLVAPVGLHLVAALQTLLLWPVVGDRAGVSETVQVLAYASVPCVLAGVPVPWVRVLCTAAGTWLLVVGLETVHGTTRGRAAVAAAVPAGVVFGYGFRGFGALVEQLAAWYII
ncbi:MAG: YIP1 family protein [Halobacteriales archaeon]